VKDCEIIKNVFKDLKKNANPQTSLAIFPSSRYHSTKRYQANLEPHPVPLTYANTGVNISEGDLFVKRIRRAVRSTYKKGVLGDIGAFGGFFEARFKGMRSPVLVSSVDGVGTKLLVAQMMHRHDTVGQDLVNHCVNDVLVCGARPLFFLDYYATGSLSIEDATSVIEGFARACRENGCSLIGGETAEMPGMYEPHKYDLAGMIVGVVERRRILTGARVRKGDVLIGLASTGLHTNGFSLARAALLDKYSVETVVDDLGCSVGDALLAVHRSYLHAVLPLIERFDIRALSHITGGGIVGNTKRVLPRGRALEIQWGSWEHPPIFDLIQHAGDVPDDDMRRTFNLGIGLVAIVPPTQSDAVMRYLTKRREKAFVIGEVT
jgi:phosphoribosylformylglycinamidine cyclo-ligase